MLDKIRKAKSMRFMMTRSADGIDGEVCSGGDGADRRDRMALVSTFDTRSVP